MPKFGITKNNFTFETNGKLMVFGVPILRHFMVLVCYDRAFIRANDFREINLWRKTSEIHTDGHVTQLF